MGTVMLTAHYHVKDGEEDTAIGHLRRMASLVREKEPGCRRYQVCRSREDPRLLLLVEEYEDDAALDAHRTTAHFREIVQGQVIPLLESREPSMFDLVVE